MAHSCALKHLAKPPFQTTSLAPGYKSLPLSCLTKTQYPFNMKSINVILGGVEDNDRVLTSASRGRKHQQTFHRKPILVPPVEIDHQGGSSFQRHICPLIKDPGFKPVALYFTRAGETFGNSELLLAHSALRALSSRVREKLVDFIE